MAQAVQNPFPYLQTALDQVEGHDCGVREAAAQDAAKAAEGIVLGGAKLAADILCGRRRGGHDTRSMPGNMQHRRQITTQRVTEEEQRTAGSASITSATNMQMSSKSQQR